MVVVDATVVVGARVVVVTELVGAVVVTPLVDADLLLLLSDVEGLLDAEGRRVPIVRRIAKAAEEPREKVLRDVSDYVATLLDALESS